MTTLGPATPSLSETDKKKEIRDVTVFMIYGISPVIVIKRITVVVKHVM